MNQDNRLYNRKTNESETKNVKLSNIPKEKWDYAIKLILVGDTNTGKTTTLYAMQRNIPKTTPISTVGVEFAAIGYEYGGKHFKLQVWDTAGQEKFRSITTSFFKNSTVALLFCDVTKRSSFISLYSWLTDLYRHAPENIEIILVANKIDLDDRRVSYEELEKFSSENSINFFEASVKNIVGLDNILDFACSRILKKIKSQDIKSIPGVREKQFVEVKTGNQKICEQCNVM